MARKHIDVVVSGIRQMTGRIREFQFTAIGGKPIPASGPGTHIKVRTGNNETGLIVRHYSLIGGTVKKDDPRHTYRIAVQREDRAGGSAYIHANFVAGTRLQVSASINNFSLARRDEHSLLLAGGLGITPIFSMARSLARRKRHFNVVYAGRAPELLALHDELAELAGPNVRFHYSGRADDGKLNLATLLAAQPLGTTAYVCGPSPLVAATHAVSREAGWPPEHVRSELFGASATGNEVGFDVVGALRPRDLSRQGCEHPRRADCCAGRRALGLPSWRVRPGPTERHLGRWTD